MKSEVQKVNYGIWTEVSKEINASLGDKSGRTVSRRTTHGFKNALNLSNNEITDENAEHLMHCAMISSAALLVNKNNGAKIAGLIILAGLVGLYQAGK